jgi:hypothetical protein
VAVRSGVKARIQSSPFQCKAGVKRGRHQVTARKLGHLATGYLKALVQTDWRLASSIPSKKSKKFFGISDIYANISILSNISTIRMDLSDKRDLSDWGNDQKPEPVADR